MIRRSQEKKAIEAHQSDLMLICGGSADCPLSVPTVKLVETVALTRRATKHGGRGRRAVVGVGVLERTMRTVTAIAG